MDTLIVTVGMYSVEESLVVISTTVNLYQFMHTAHNLQNWQHKLTMIKILMNGDTYQYTISASVSTQTNLH